MFHVECTHIYTQGGGWVVRKGIVCFYLNLHKFINENVLVFQKLKKKRGGEK